VDHFVNAYGVMLAGLSETIFLGYYFGTKKLRDHFNPISDFQVGTWWDILIKYFTPKRGGSK